jgi:hypothetical protein
MTAVTPPASPGTSTQHKRIISYYLPHRLLLLGLVAAVLRHHMDTRVKTEDGVRVLTHMSPLGSTLRERGGGKRPLVALDWRSASAERYRTVRTALKFATVDRELRHFTVTSWATGEGKTTVACNLGISWAQAGSSVCLVEADLRRPGISSFLGLDGSLGLSDVVVGDSRLDDVLVRWNQRMLTVLPAGSLPPDPAAQLGSSATSSALSSAGCGGSRRASVCAGAPCRSRDAATAWPTHAPEDRAMST